MIVSGYQILRLSSDRALEDSIVRGIFLYCINLFSAHDFFAEVPDALSGQRHGLFRPAELVPQQPRHFVKDVVGNCKVYQTGACETEKIIWRPAEVQS